MDRIEERKRQSKRRRRESLDAGIGPLVSRLREYDAARERLEREGGTAEDIGRIARLLERMIILRDHRDRRFLVRLTEHEALRSRLSEVGDRDIRFDVRVTVSGMPVYYLCRTRNDYWANYTFIVEDIYRSPGYPSFDDRFCRLMVFGRESNLLRLSHLREGVSRLFGASAAPRRDEIDFVLHRVGRAVLHDAWHEDQMSGMLAARLFGLEHFRDAIELLYLCLGCDLCELRSSVDEEMIHFFETVYPQPAIRSLLESLRDRKGSDLAEIGRRALNGYVRLSREFASLLSVSLDPGTGGPKRPLFKLVFANFYRLEMLAGLVRENPALTGPLERVESSSKAVISDVIGLNAALIAA